MGFGVTLQTLCITSATLHPPKWPLPERLQAAYEGTLQCMKKSAIHPPGNPLGGQSWSLLLGEATPPFLTNGRGGG